MQIYFPHGWISVQKKVENYDLQLISSKDSKKIRAYTDSKMENQASY